VTFYALSSIKVGYQTSFLNAMSPQTIIMAWGWVLDFAYFEIIGTIFLCDIKLSLNLLPYLFCLPGECCYKKQLFYTWQHDISHVNSSKMCHLSLTNIFLMFCSMKKPIILQYSRIKLKYWIHGKKIIVKIFDLIFVVTDVHNVFSLSTKIL
jgi:hypothetical protein